TILSTNYITVFATQSQSIVQSGDTLISFNGFSGYQWFYNSDSIQGATNSFYVASQSGDYNVVCTDANGCEVEAGIFNVLAQLPVITEDATFILTPNPA